MSAQQTQLGMNAGSFPAGITVMVTGNARVSTWRKTADFQAQKNGAPVEQLVSALEAAGVPARDVAVFPATIGFRSRAWVRATYAAGRESAALRAARTDHYEITGITLIPDDEQALYEQALSLAIEQGRKEAMAIAQADHQRVGRLLNFIPSPLELLRAAAAQTNGMAPLMPDSTGTVTASGLATFELLPSAPERK